MNKILIISYAFPPDKNSQAQHVFGISNVLSINNKVDCLTVQKKPLDEKVQFNMFYAKQGILHSNRSDTGSLKNNTKIKDSPNIVKKNSISQKMKNLIIPDPVADWYFEALKTFKNSLNTDYDVIIGVATPYTDLFVAKKIWSIVRKSNKNVKLIYIYADPWYGEKSKKKSGFRIYIEKKLEQYLLKHADFIFMVTENAMQHYIKAFPKIRNKIDYYYLGHNFNPDIINKHMSECNKKSENIKYIKYFGAIQSVHRDPYNFLTALEQPEFVGKVKVELFLIPHISHKNLIEKINSSLILQQIIDVKNAIPYRDMVQEILKSDYLLLFGNSSKLQIPGKLFDYIGLNGKILYIKNNNNDEIEKILMKYGKSIIVENDIEQIKQSIKKIINDFTSLNINYEIPHLLYRDNCYKKLDEKVSELICQKK